MQLYDDALQIAPTDLVADLQSVRDAFQQSLRSSPNPAGSEFPEDAFKRVKDYNLAVCGAFVGLGSMD